MSMETARIVLLIWHATQVQHKQVQTIVSVKIILIGMMLIMEA